MLDNPKFFGILKIKNNNATQLLTENPSQSKGTSPAI